MTATPPAQREDAHGTRSAKMATRDHGEDQGSDISRPLLLASSVTVSRGPIEAGFGLTTPGSLPPRHANRQSSQERRPDDESTDMSRNGPNLDRQ